MAVATRVARRPRAYVRVQGPDAEDFLQRMLSNDVSAEVCDALLLTPKARVIAPVRVWRRMPDDFLLLTEPELGEVPLLLLRARFAARCEIEPEEHTSAIVFGAAEGIPTTDYGVPAVEVLDDPAEPTMGDGELERLRIRRGHRASAARSTRACCRPKPDSSSERSRSQRAAIPARSPSPG